MGGLIDLLGWCGFYTGGNHNSQPPCTDVRLSRHMARLLGRVSKCFLDTYGIVKAIIKGFTDMILFHNRNLDMMLGTAISVY